MKYLLMFFIIAGTGTYFLMGNSQEKSQKNAQIHNDAIIKVDNSNEARESKLNIGINNNDKEAINISSSNVEAQPFEDVKQEYLKCTGRDISSLKDMNSIKDEVLKEAKLDFDKFDQYDIVLPSGEKRYVDIINEFDENGKKVTMVQFYKIDDGFPVYLSMANELKLNPSKAKLKEFLAMGKIVQHNKAQAYMGSNGNPIDVLTYNNDVKEIKVSGNKVFDCSMDDNENTTCKCI